MEVWLRCAIPASAGLHGQGFGCGILVPDERLSYIRGLGAGDQSLELNQRAVLLTSHTYRCRLSAAGRALDKELIWAALKKCTSRVRRQACARMS